MLIKYSRAVKLYSHWTIVAGPVCAFMWPRKRGGGHKSRCASALLVGQLLLCGDRVTRRTDIDRQKRYFYMQSLWFSLTQNTLLYHSKFRWHVRIMKSPANLNGLFNFQFISPSNPRIQFIHRAWQACSVGGAWLCVQLVRARRCVRDWPAPAHIPPAVTAPPRWLRTRLMRVPKWH